MTELLLLLAPSCLAGWYLLRTLGDGLDAAGRYVEDDHHREMKKLAEQFR